MKQLRSTKNDEEDQKVIKLLQDLESLEPEYPPELLSARRAAFLAQIKQLKTVGVEEGLAPGDQEMVKLLGKLKSAEAEYPPESLAARRSAFLHQIETAKNISLLDKLRVSINSIFQHGITISSVPLPDLMRTSLVVASLIVAAVIASLLFTHTGQFLKPSPLQGVAEPTRVLPTSTYQVATILCKPGDQASPCPTGDLDLGQDLADQGNGMARPAVSKDVLSSSDRVHKAAYVNDGRSGASWVSKSAYSWIKIDLGKATTINSVSLQRGSLGSSDDNNLGQFVVAVALSDDYTDGNNGNDYTEYAQVFNSEQTGFSGIISNAETVRTLFPRVKARFVKITFEKAGAAIDEVGVFMVQPPVLAEQPTRTPQGIVPGVALTPIITNALFPKETATPFAIDTRLPTGTLAPLSTKEGLPTDTPIPILTDTRHPSDTPIPLPTNTPPPANTAIPVSTEPLALDTPSFFTVVPPTAIPLTAQAPSQSTGKITITGNDQTLTFTCNGNVVEVRGYANTVTLLGSCSGITVTGNGNRVFWQSGSPIITNTGKENIISQM
jgi:Protein of unknown function (DUF3060)./F5/8 type C domain.